MSTLNIAISLGNTDLAISRAFSDSITVSGAKPATHTQAIATTDTTVSLAEVGTVGYVFVENLDATNFITVGADGSSYPVKCLAGEGALFRFNGAAIHAKADTASCNVRFTILPA